MTNALLVALFLLATNAKGGEGHMPEIQVSFSPAFAVQGKGHVVTLSDDQFLVATANDIAMGSVSNHRQRVVIESLVDPEMSLSVGNVNEQVARATATMLWTGEQPMKSEGGGSLGSACAERFYDQGIEDFDTYIYGGFATCGQFLELEDQAKCMAAYLARYWDQCCEACETYRRCCEELDEPLNRMILTWCAEVPPCD